VRHNSVLTGGGTGSRTTWRDLWKLYGWVMQSVAVALHELETKVCEVRFELAGARACAGEQVCAACASTGNYVLRARECAACVQVYT